MKHIILTRFNLQYEADSHPGIEENWLATRMQLFEHYCLPSVQKQTVQDFIWVLLCDCDTPDVYKKRLEGYKKQIPQIEIVYASWMEDVNELYRQVGEKYGKFDGTLISTRLDNDDALALTYIEQVQKIGEGMHEGIITFANGRQSFVHDKHSYNVRFEANHFTSRIEKSGYYTALGFDHMKLASTGLELRIIDTDEPMWEEFVHGTNLMNDYMPRYKYTVTSWSDAIYLMRCWLEFQTQRGLRLLKRLLVVPNK